MDSSIRNRLLTILFVFGLGIYALLPSLRYSLMDEEKKSNLSDDQIDYFESRSIKQGLDLKGGIYIVLEVDLPQLIDNLAKNKDNNFNEFLIDLKNEYNNSSSDFFTVFENLKQLGTNENGGNDRIAYSDYDIEARKYLSNKLENIGAKVYTDFAGNLIAIYNPSNSKLKPISFGSHIDAVPNGGHYDGQVGVIGSVELLQTIHLNKIKLNHPLELLVSVSYTHLTLPTNREV